MYHVMVACFPRGETCSKCRRGCLEVAATRSGDSCSYVCDRRACRYSESVCAREPGFFLARVPLGKQMLVLYKMIYDWQPGVARLALDLEMDEHTVQDLVDGVRRCVSWVMRRANSILQVGGVDEDVEADEVCFRCKPFMRDGVKMRKWFRYLGVVRRGSALYYWGELEERDTEVSQGGGGPIGDAELEQHMLHRPSGRSLLAPWSVLHTDGARVYMKLRRSGGSPIYRKLRLSHTFVRHSRKKNKEGKLMPVQFVVLRRIKRRDGQYEWRKGGTQRKDGFWQMVRRHVSRRSVNTCQEATMGHMCLFFQWLYWRSDDPIGDAWRGRRTELPSADRLAALGEIRRQVREQLGDDLLRLHGLRCDEALQERAMDALPRLEKRHRVKRPAM